MHICDIPKKGPTRVRYYTNHKGSNCIEQDGEKKYQIKLGRGRDYVETDVPNSQLEWVNNPRYCTPELTVKGDLSLNNSTVTRRK